MVFLGPFGPPFYEFGNFVKILDTPPPFRKISQVKFGNFVNFLLPTPPFEIFSQKNTMFEF